MEWVNAHVARTRMSKADLAHLAVSMQLLVSNLLEELELLSTQINAQRLPAIRACMAGLQEAIQEDLTSLAMADKPGGSEGSEVRNKISQIRDLLRCKSHVEILQQRLVEANGV